MFNKYGFELFSERISTESCINLVKFDSPILCDQFFKKFGFLSNDIVIVRHLNTLKRLIKSKKSITIFTHLSSLEYFLKFNEIKYNQYSVGSFFYKKDSYEYYYRLSSIENGKFEDIFALNRKDIEILIRSIKIDKILD